MSKLLELNKKSKKKKKNEKMKKARSQPSMINFTTGRGIIDNLQTKKIDQALLKTMVVMNRPFLDVEHPARAHHEGQLPHVLSQAPVGSGSDNQAQGSPG